MKLRRYEIGGGYQGLPKQFKAAALEGTGQCNYDFQACHPSIFSQFVNHFAGKSTLQQLIEHGYSSVANLLTKTLKKATCATINKAAIKGLIKNQHRAIAQIILEDPTTTTTNYSVRAKSVETTLKPIGRERRMIAKELQLANTPAALSTLYQQVEQAALEITHAGTAVANEHDGWVGPDIGRSGTTTIVHKGVQIHLRWRDNNHPLLNINTEGYSLETPGSSQNKR